VAPHDSIETLLQREQNNPTNDIAEKDQLPASAKEEAKDALKESMEYLLNKIDTSENSLATGIIKFSERCKTT
jgi:hypothetical protein